MHGMVLAVQRSFVRMEETAVSCRERAMDRKADFEDIAKEYHILGMSGPGTVSLDGFHEERGIDHRGGDIVCGKFGTVSALASQCLHDSSCRAFTLRDGLPWCLKHLRYDSGSVSDITHVFFTKLVQSGGVVQTPDQVQAYMRRWSDASSLLMRVEDVVGRVVMKTGLIEEELQEMGMYLTELQGVLHVDPEAKHRVDELINEIGRAFNEIVDHLQPMMK